MGLWGGAVAVLAASAARQVRRPGRRGARAEDAPRGGWDRLLAEPRTAVLLALAAVILFGGGRKVLQVWNARRAVGRLGEPDVTLEEVEAAASHGRAGLVELFRLLGSADSEPLRRAAGHALSVLWARDELIAEEEQGLVRRGYAVAWHARRRYPRALRAAIPVTVSYGVPFLREAGPGVTPSNLEWSHRIEGARRASLEPFSPWTPGPGRAEFSLVPADFDAKGPHRLVLHARVRTAGLTDPWEITLPQVPFSLEFDPALSVEALLALADSNRAETIAGSVRLEQGAGAGEDGSVFMTLSDQMALRNPPALAVTTPLPCDLAHAISLEFEGVPGRFPAGAVVLSGQGEGQAEASAVRRFPLGPVTGLPSDAIERPGPRRLRAVLTADPDRGWADPDVRSIWPGEIVTDWVEAEVVRR
jgi:hypothetical protein